MILIRNFRRYFNKAVKQPIYALIVFFKRAKAYFYYVFGNGRSCYPEAITLFLTHKCNLKCRMCGQWGESGVTRKMSPHFISQELAFNELKNLVDDISSFRPNITLFGGEPLLHPDCLKLIKYIKSKKIHCLMITNGYMLGNFQIDIVESGLDELNVSLDGGEELHDEIRGMPGLFRKIVNGIKDINKIKKEKGTKKPFINLQCTINKYNYEKLHELIDVVKDIEADSLTFHNLIFLERDLVEKQKIVDELLGCSSSDWDGFIFNPGIDPVILYKKIQEILRGGYSFSIDFYPNFSKKDIIEYYENPSYVPSGYSSRCISPWIAAYIFPDGEVRPCLNFNYSYGNIKESKFSELWNNERAVRYRNQLKKLCIFPVCVRCTELYRY